MQLDVQQVVEYTHGALVGGDAESNSMFNGITWDSRAVKAGNLYVAIPGERVDGHRFVASAIESGAHGALISIDPDEHMVEAACRCGAALIRVKDARDAITDLARAWRGHLTGKVIAITGSTGKTTTKNLVRDVAASAFSVVATQANQNNELGVPNTILRAEADTQVVVVEMGMRGSGQIAALCEFARPDWGIINNVGDAHAELLGSRDAIACAKTELFEGLPAGNGRAFANAADDYCAFSCERAQLGARGIATVFFNGDQGESAVWAEDVALDARGCPSFTLCARGMSSEDAQRIPCMLVLRGLHNVSNACAAAAVGLSLGISLQGVAEALAAAMPEDGRQMVFETKEGVTVVDDSYNANPDSMRASLNLFAAMDVRGRRIAVLGDMAELGENAVKLHEEMGETVAHLGIDRLICLGALARNIAGSAKKAGMSAANVVCADTISDVLDELARCLESGDAVLAKASNCMNLKQVVKELVK